MLGSEGSDVAVFPYTPMWCLKVGPMSFIFEYIYIYVYHRSPYGAAVLNNPICGALVW